MNGFLFCRNKKGGGGKALCNKPQHFICRAPASLLFQSLRCLSFHPQRQGYFNDTNGNGCLCYPPTPANPPTLFSFIFIPLFSVSFSTESFILRSPQTPFLHLPSVTKRHLREILTARPLKVDVTSIKHIKNKRKKMQSGKCLSNKKCPPNQNTNVSSSFIKK